MSGYILTIGPIGRRMRGYILTIGPIGRRMCGYILTIGPIGRRSALKKVLGLSYYLDGKMEMNGRNIAA
eukprot:5158654-Pyramimonas_sp.AAC.1